MSTSVKNDNSAVLLVIPLGFAIFSYSKGYSVGKGVLVTVLGTFAISVAVGIYSVASLTSKLVSKNY